MLLFWNKDIIYLIIRSGRTRLFFVKTPFGLLSTPADSWQNHFNRLIITTDSGNCQGYLLHLDVKKALGSL